MSHIIDPTCQLFRIEELEVNEEILDIRGSILRATLDDCGPYEQASVVDYTLDDMEFFSESHYINRKGEKDWNEGYVPLPEGYEDAVLQAIEGYEDYLHEIIIDEYYSSDD